MRRHAAWKPDSGYWIMADFRDETHQWRCVSRGPQQPPWKVHTKKGQNSAVMEVMEAMEIQPVPGMTGSRRKAIAVMEAGAMDNGEAAPASASPARDLTQTSIWAGFANRWTRWSEPRNLERCRVSQARGAGP